MTGNNKVEDCPPCSSNPLGTAIIQARKHSRMNNRALWSTEPIASCALKILEVRNSEFSAGLQFAAARSARSLVARQLKSRNPVHPFPVAFRLREVA